MVVLVIVVVVAVVVIVPIIAAVIFDLFCDGVVGIWENVEICCSDERHCSNNVSWWQFS